MSAISDDLPVLLSPTNSVKGARLAFCSSPKHRKSLTDTDFMNVVGVWSCAVVMVQVRSWPGPDRDGYSDTHAIACYLPCGTDRSPATALYSSPS